MCVRCVSLFIRACVSACDIARVRAHVYVCVFEWCLFVGLCVHACVGLGVCGRALRACAWIMNFQTKGSICKRNSMNMICPTLRVTRVSAVTRSHTLSSPHPPTRQPACWQPGCMSTDSPRISRKTVSSTGHPRGLFTSRKTDLTTSPHGTNPHAFWFPDFLPKYVCVWRTSVTSMFYPLPQEKLP